jgi:hypothetical protein
MTNLFLFNRAIMNAEKTFLLMLKSVFIITLFRFIALIIISLYATTSITISLILLFIIPFSFEIYYFGNKVLNSVKFNSICIESWQGFYQFISFCSQVFISGALFVICDRIYLMHLRTENMSLAATLSFALGFVGVISVFNMSFTNYFLGKINPNDIKEIIQFKLRVNKFFVPFMLITFVLITVITFFVHCFYPRIGGGLIPALIILIMKTALVSFMGFTNVLSKTLNLQHFELGINILRLIAIYVFVQFSYKLGFVPSLVGISLVLIIGELILSKLINVRISNRGL